MSDERIPLIDALAEILRGYEDLQEDDQRGHVEKLLGCVLEIAADADVCVKDGCGETLLRTSLRAHRERVGDEITSLIEEAAERQGAGVRVGMLGPDSIGPAGGMKIGGDS